MRSARRKSRRDAHASVPLGLHFLDETGRPRTLAQAIDGRPALLVFADYTCHTLCGPILTFAAAALEQTGLRAREGLPPASSSASTPRTGSTMRAR